jgi:replicative DNA helicase
MNSGIAELIVGKQRNGLTGKFELAFIKQFTKFGPWQDPSDFRFRLQIAD